jgi:hypothetical protein
LPNSAIGNEVAPAVHVVHHLGRRALQKVRSFIDLAVQALWAHSALS